MMFQNLLKWRCKVGVLYNYEQVESFALIGLHNLLNSANKDKLDLKTLKMFLDPLEKLHSKEFAVNYANTLLEEENKKDKKLKEKNKNNDIQE